MFMITGQLYTNIEGSIDAFALFVKNYVNIKRLADFVRSQFQVEDLNAFSSDQDLKLGERLRQHNFCYLLGGCEFHTLLVQAGLSGHLCQMMQDRSCSKY